MRIRRIHWFTGVTALLLLLWLAALAAHWRALRSAPAAAAAAATAAGDAWRVGALVALQHDSARASSVRRAVVTLVTQREYLVGACALGASLRRVRTRWPLVACLPPDLAAHAAVRRNLSVAGFDFVRVVARLGNPARRLGRLHQAHKVDVFTKLRVFQLTEFERVLYLDADTVVQRNVDALLELPDAFAIAPEVTPMWRCIGQQFFIFTDELQRDDWCHGHTRELYHGRVVKLSNTGVMALAPSNATFDALWNLTLSELEHSDTCIGLAGCNDQRVINLYYDLRPHKQLSVLYNVFCDQFMQGNFSVFRHHRPYVFHYRGGPSFKRWILEPDAPRSAWNDPCGAFVSAFDDYEARFAAAAQVKAT